MSRYNEQYHFDCDDLPAPMGMPAYAGGRSRITLQVNGRFGSSLYEDICFMWERDAAKEACEALNKSVYLPVFVEVIERACRYHQWRGERGDQPDWSGPKGTRKGFHWRDGHYFNRTGDGGVRVTKFKHGGSSDEIDSDIVIPASEWASIVCAVSTLGESGGRFEAAQDFHGRDISVSEKRAEDAERERDQARAVVDRLGREAEEGLELWKKCVAHDEAATAHLQSERDSARAALGKVVEALKPFADVPLLPNTEGSNEIRLDEVRLYGADIEGVATYIKVAAFQTARSALKDAGK